jgi:hypothetical protein
VLEQEKEFQFEGKPSRRHWFFYFTLVYLLLGKKEKKHR